MIPEIISDGLTGMLVEPGDESGLAKTILKLIVNRDLAEEMGKKARESLSDKYSWEKQADFLTSIFKEVRRGHNFSEAYSSYALRETNPK